jgi:hypothetical protein
LNDELLFDGVTVLVYDYLVPNEFNVPISLRSYGARSVYHQEWLRSNVAEQLYEAGLYSIDILDGTGNTPILLGSISGSQYYWDIFTWLLHKGAVSFREKWGTTRTFFHFIDSSLCPWGRKLLPCQGCLNYADAP